MELSMKKFVCCCLNSLPLAGPLLAYLSEFSDVVQLVDLRAQRVEDGHVVGVLQQLLLQVLEHSQRVAEQNLKMRQVT